MRVHLVNPSDVSFGVAVITPRWLYVLASATPPSCGVPTLVDETLVPLDLNTVAPGDIVGIGIHTGNAHRGYAIGRQARQRGACVVYGGIHASLYAAEALDVGQAHAVVKGFGLPTDTSGTFDATAALAQAADVSFAQFVLMTPLPGTVDFEKWEKSQGADVATVDEVPLTRHWLLPPNRRPKVYTPHPLLTPDEIRRGTQTAWDSFYSLPHIWKRAECVRSVKAKLAFVLISKLYRQMYANTGIATDSARHTRASRIARLLAKPCRRLFVAPVA